MFVRYLPPLFPLVRNSDSPVWHLTADDPVRDSDKFVQYLPPLSPLVRYSDSPVRHLTEDDPVRDSDKSVRYPVSLTPLSLNRTTMSDVSPGRPCP